MGYKKEVENDVANFFHNNQIYYNSNEELNTILDYFDFNDKNVFSVLGSGDQAFHLINRGANTVDLFDVNNYAKYYFYLRIWIIKYLNTYYYNNHLSTDFIYDLLRCVKPSNQEEKIAYYFWKTIIKSDRFNQFEKIIFIRDFHYMKKNNIEDVELLKKQLGSRDFNFDNIDITDPLKKDKKYDYVFMSNILEWMENESFEKIWNLARNVYDLLDDDGKVICSRLEYNFDKRARDVLSRMFNYNYIEGEGNMRDYRSIYKGYYLVKK